MTKWSCIFVAGSRSKGDAAFEDRSIVSLFDTGRGWDDAGVGPVVKRWEHDPGDKETHGQDIAGHVLLAVHEGLEL